MISIEETETGTCKICGCTENNACCHPEYGPCWWVDESENLCSHCADESYDHSLKAMQRINGELYELD
jgi:hypothetical protein